MVFDMSEEPQTIKVYNLSSDTNEFIGEGDAYIPPHTGLPANSTTIAPPETKKGFATIFNAEVNEWSYVEDHREETVYDIRDGRPVFITELGPLPDSLTTIEPCGEFQLWDGSKWVKDDNAERDALINEAASTKNELMMEANTRITPLQYSVDVDMATQNEKEELLLWKKYMVLLNRVDVSVAPNIEWPDKPA